eukprot:6210617-Pleurochrysis_carterae.AAC.1
MKQTDGSHAAIPPGNVALPLTMPSQVEARHHFSALCLPSLFFRKSIGRFMPAKNAARRSRHQESACRKMRCLKSSFAMFKESACSISGIISVMSNSRVGSMNSRWPECFAA